MLVSISIFAVLSLVVGLLIAWPMGVVKLAAAQMVAR
jgi:hypothetical protein